MSATIALAFTILATGSVAQAQVCEGFTRVSVFGSAGYAPPGRSWGVELLTDAKGKIHVRGDVRGALTDEQRREVCRLVLKLRPVARELFGPSDATDEPSHAVRLRGPRGEANYEVESKMESVPPTREFCDLLDVFVYVRGLVASDQAIDMRPEFRRYLAKHRCAELQTR